MRLRGIYWKITLPLVLVIVLGTAALGAYTIVKTRSAQTNELRSYLVNEARLVADASQPDFLPQNQTALDALAKTTGQQITARITLIALDGTVLGDSWEDPSTLENHATRPEVVQALATGVGVSTRFSTTVGENLMYAAVPVSNNGTAIGVARVALPLTTVEATVGSGTLATIITLFVVAFLAVLLTGFFTRRITSPLREITRATEALTEGDLSRRVPIYTKDEVGQLGQAFNRMAEQLSQTTALASAEKSRLEAIFSNLADGILMVGADGRVTLANASAARLFKFDINESRGRSLIEVVRDYKVDALYKKCILSAHDESAQMESGGSYLQVIAAPLKEERPGGAILLFQDLSQVRNVQTMRQEFVANVSHELRTPLAGIKAIVETLRAGALDDKKVAGDFLERVDSEVDRLTQMVDELMELSRIEGGREKLDLKPVDINLLLAEAAERFTLQAQRQNLTIALTLDPDLPGVMADWAHLTQVINNILHNAIKFTPSQGKITIFSRMEKDRVIVDVADTGIGISPSDLPRVFERFYKVDKSRSGAGTGLGLAIARHIIESHGGRIWATSEQGKGSVFSFSLPLNPSI